MNRRMPSFRPSRASCAARTPTTNQNIGAVVLPLIEAAGFNVRILLTILGLIGLLVVVVACANVASVIVARSLARRHELAVHAALGATRADRIRQLAIEGLMVSSAASVVGLLVAAWGIAGLRWLGSTRVRLRRHADERPRARRGSAHRMCDAQLASGCCRRCAWRPPIRRSCVTAHVPPAPHAAAAACET